MLKLLFVLLTIFIILFIFWNKNKRIGNLKKSNFYKNLFIIVVVAGILFFLATSGKFVLPQLMQIFKMILPLITRLIGI